MDPIPAHFPILSYVMTRFPSIGSLRQPKSPSSPSPSVIDIEQPASTPDPNPHFHDSLVSRMPHLKDPNIISEMSAAVSKIAQTRSLIQTLGPRPDHESVDSARSKLAEIDFSLSAAADDGETGAGGERERLVGAAVAAVAGGERERLEREKAMFKAIVQVDETHEAYEKMLHEAEERLRRIYNKAVTARGGGGAAAEETEEVVEEVNEDVIRVLKEEGDVERVDLCGKKLRILPEAFGRLKRVVRLDLSSNQLQGIPDSISGIENLEELNISSNSLRSLPDSIGLLLKMKILNVSGNKLTALPDSIAQCKSLVELDASCNNLGYLPTKIGFELVNLRKLLVQYNKIRSLPTSVGEMKSLELLDIHFNELRVLPRTIGQLTNLITLNLSGNFSDLKELPDTFGDLLNLEELDLSNNQIHALPYSFCRLEKLRKLNLDQNPIFLPPVEVVNKGVTAVRVYMAEKWQEFLKEEEERSRRGNQEDGETGWLKRSVSKLNDVVSTVSEYLGSPRSPHDPCLNQER